MALFYPAIFRYCYWHTSNRAAAEDATQTTFLRFVGSLPTYSHRGKLNAYLYCIAKNICINIAMKNPSEVLCDELPYNELGFAQSEANADLTALVAVLPEEQREIVLLRFGADLKLREIAEVTRLPLRTVQSRLRSALKHLKKSLTEKEGKMR